MRVCQQPQLQGFFWTEHCWAHLNAPGAPTARRWRHLSARRTAEQQKLFVDVLFWSLWAGFLQVWTPNRVSWSWSPPFAPAVTHQCGNPAKMKWMFKEDHSLGKKGLGCCYETRERCPLFMSRVFPFCSADCVSFDVAPPPITDTLTRGFRRSLPEIDPA